MKLKFKKQGEGQAFIILHGLFGSSDNWQTHAKKLADYFEVYSIDQRNHGLSDWSEDFNYDIMADDLKEFIDDHNITNFILMGHSMGGKTAMTFVQKYPDLVDKLIVVDMGVKSYPIHHDGIIQGLQSIELNQVNSRSEADEQLSKSIKNQAIRNFLLKNLYWKEKKQLAWRINIDVLAEKLPEIVAALPNEENLTPVLFMRGGQSDYIEENDIPKIKEIFPISTFHTIEKAGHWIHAEAPTEFIEKVIGFSLR